MGQTLTHGVYLPDEGERNCYAGLAANWQLLDNSVGTIAEHTTALAGKAPAVHTHVKADITDFPAFGNAAGTICEGNDARLSDARTPTAHTHTKSDVTDLLNSNFIPSANNSYNLGSSSYQWNNVYSKGYYYNGVAWGLDKNNKWLTTNLFYGSLPIFLRGSDNDTYNVSPQSLVQSLISFVDKNNTTMSNIVFQHRTEATETHRLCLRQQKVTSDGYYGVNLNNLGDFYSEHNNTINLGTSTNKWKSLNGINPGALSLPDISKYTDLISNIPSASLDGHTDIDLSSYITSNGWLSIVVPDTNTDDFIFCQNGSTLNNRFFMSGAKGNDFISLMMPINRTGTVKVQIKASSVTFCRFYQCLGNV